MPCNGCKKRDMCEEICPYMEKVISKTAASRRELPLPDRSLIFLVEDHWRASTAAYHDRHSDLLPELQRRMENLTPKQQRIIRWYYLEEMTIPEIATRLKISQPSVSDRLQRALNKLQSENGHNG